MHAITFVEVSCKIGWEEGITYAAIQSSYNVVVLAEFWTCREQDTANGNGVAGSELHPLASQLRIGIRVV